MDAYVAKNCTQFYLKYDTCVTPLLSRHAKQSEKYEITFPQVWSHSTLYCGIWSTLENSLEDTQKNPQTNAFCRLYMNSSLVALKVTEEEGVWHTCTQLREAELWNIPLLCGSGTGLHHIVLGNVTQWRRETGGIYQRRVQLTGVWHQVPMGETWQPFQKTSDSRSPND